LVLARAERALIFDLDGTLVDTVYAHVFAWQRAFDEVGLLSGGYLSGRVMRGVYSNLPLEVGGVCEYRRWAIRSAQEDQPYVS
jgi:phosphoserine phosphatase